MVKAASISETDAKFDEVSKRPIQKSETDFKDRLLEAIAGEPVAAFSRRCGAGESLLRGYLKNGNKPGVDHLVAIADAANVNIEWLAAGRGQKLRGTVSASKTVAEVSESTRFDDYDRLVLAITTVEAALAASNKVLPPDKHAQVIAISYRILADRDQRDNVVEFIKMAA